MVLYRTRKDRLSRPIDRADPDDSNEGKVDLILRKTKKEELDSSSFFPAWWLRPVPLRRHLPFQGSALLTELPSHA